ncbi:MAG TPA: SUMF1/EgtB/PvdO family nonheme iron enzyme [Polyangiaceae bacterium]|nr:SUMF1/EgtB/PvdO family nonheme iron enzyme [Polyangiaceae bacterium]
MRRSSLLVMWLAGLGGIPGCRKPAPEERTLPETGVAAERDAPLGEEGRGAGDAAASEADAAGAAEIDDAGPPIEAGRVRWCSKEMVNVAGRFCIDRFEASLIDEESGEGLSPHYPPEPNIALRIFNRWDEQRLTTGPLSAHEMPLPALSELERGESFRPKATSVRGVLPQAYISGRVAGEACARAKKRLCTREEWTFACRGERQTKYPYGPEYKAGVCNVHRMAHPAQILHDNASAGHSDPRLGLVEAEDGPLLRTTGSTKTCVSRWGKDVVYDMVGNVDEWIDDPDGTFLGGFFSRGTTNGCDSSVSTHPLLHWDYSIGFRCCR